MQSRRKLNFPFASGVRASPIFSGISSLTFLVFPSLSCHFFPPLLQYTENWKITSPEHFFREASMTEPIAPAKVCVVIGRTRHKMMQLEIQEAAKRGAEMIELRLDFLAKAPDFKRLLKNKPCPMVATVRRVQDGGRWAGSEEARQMLLRQAIVAGFDWVDLETDVANTIRRFAKVKRIVSCHNLRAIPENLEEIHAHMCQQDCDVVKIAVTPHHPSDNLRVLNLLKNPAKPTVAFCMGELGFPSRFLGAVHGTPFAYAAFNKERGIAPGLPSSHDMIHLYRYPEIDSSTPFYGVLGDPVGHSLSPLIHNKALQHLKLPGVYLPFRVPRGELEEFHQAFRTLPVQGFSVTIPHKEAALHLADHQEETAQRIGAANTLVRSGDGWIAYNTDSEAALESIKANLQPLPDGSPGQLNDMTVLILGAGGVARAIAHALQRTGALTTITNRTQERAQRLAEEVGCRFVDWTSRHSVLADLLINCTSVGMHPNVDETPLHNSFLRPGLMVFETIYTPETTLLVKEARERGCHVLTGVDMFVRQAGLQFRLFTGQAAPLELMDKIVRRELSPVSVKDTD
jgi:3-dehydroquinate dehydratase/shikimate dehydrogenase